MPCGHVANPSKICYSAAMTEVQIYRRALERIARLKCSSLERYVARADAIAVEALILGENVDQCVVKDDKIAGAIPRAA